MGSKYSPSALDQLFDQISTRAENSVQALIDQRKQLAELNSKYNLLAQRYEATVSQCQALEAQNQLLAEQNQELFEENHILNSHLAPLAEKLKAFAESPIVVPALALETNEDYPPAGAEVEGVDKFSAKEILVQWSERYPQAFSRNAVQPLKIGIHEDLALQEALPDHWIRRALASYVRQPRYLRTIKSGAVRMDLAGNNAGFVTAEEAQHAQAQLAVIRQQRQQKERALKNKQEAKRLQSKLAQLVTLNHA